MGQRCRSDEDRRSRRFEGEVNVAFWVQDFIDSGIGDYDNPDFKKLVARLKSIGVEFPYKPAMDNTEENE